MIEYINLEDSLKYFAENRHNIDSFVQAIYSIIGLVKSNTKVFIATNFEEKSNWRNDIKLHLNNQNMANLSLKTYRKARYIQVFCSNYVVGLFNNNCGISEIDLYNLLYQIEKSDALDGIIFIIGKEKIIFNRLMVRRILYGIWHDLMP